MPYNCEYPECQYVTVSRNHIHKHHIIPKELCGTNHKNNLMFLCPNHHCKIYIPEAKKGIHSIKNKDSIVIKGKLLSTSGIVLEYIENDEVKYYFYN